MKRITTLLTFLLLASIVLAACGPAETAAPAPAGEQPAGEEPAEVGDQPVTIDLWQHDSGRLQREHRPRRAKRPKAARAWLQFAVSGPCIGVG
jgi:hypothetical protein